MTVPRVIGLFAIFGGLGIAVVALRGDQVRRSHHIQQLQFEQIDLQQTIWANAMEIARLRSPQMIRDRAKRFSVPVLPPYEEKSVVPPDESWVADQ